MLQSQLQTRESFLVSHVRRIEGILDELLGSILLQVLSQVFVGLEGHVAVEEDVVTAQRYHGSQLCMQNRSNSAFSFI